MADQRMSDDVQGEITQLLSKAAGGSDDADAARDRLAALVHDDLHRIARAHFHNESPGHTLQPTAIVNEGWMKLAAQDRVQWQDREHFLAVASLTMRRILLDHARERKRLRRGGDRRRQELNATISMEDGRNEELDLEELAKALDELSRLDQDLAHIVDLRYIAGLTVEETARVTHLSPATVKRRWTLARGWLKDRMHSMRPDE